MSQKEDLGWQQQSTQGLSGEPQMLCHRMLCHLVHPSSAKVMCGQPSRLSPKKQQERGPATLAWGNQRHRQAAKHEDAAQWQSQPQQKVPPSFGNAFSATLRGRTFASDILKIKASLVLDLFLELCFELGCRVPTLLETFANASFFLRRSWQRGRSAGCMWSST